MLLVEFEGKKCFSSEIEHFLEYKQNRKFLSKLRNKDLANTVDSDGTTLLHLSAKYRNVTMTKYLIQKNLNVNAVDSSGETPLMIALQTHTNIETWLVLLNGGADLWKIKNNSGQSAMMIIIQSYRGQAHLMNCIMEWVKEKGDPVCVTADAFFTAGCQVYHLDVFLDPEITKHMLRCFSGSVNIQDSQNDNNTALHVAAEMDDLENIEILLEYGADKNITNSDGCPPIVLAFENKITNIELISLLMPDGKDWILKGDSMNQIFGNGTKEDVEFFLKHFDLDPNVKDSNGNTAFYYSLWNEDSRVWELFKDFEVDVDARYQSNETSLHIAVKCGHREAVQFLVDKGADVHALDDLEEPPIYEIPVTDEINLDRYRDCIEILLENGANAQLVHDEGYTVIFIAITYRHYDVLDSILTHLAIIEGCGSMLDQTILNDIDGNILSKNSFEKCREEIKQMKEKVICGRVTLFQFLMGIDNKICKFVQNKEIVRELSKIEGDNYLHRLLIKRFKYAMKISRLRSTAIHLISECIPIFNRNHVILEIIIASFSTKDLELIANSTE